MLQTYLINGLIFCGILLLIAFIIASVQIILVLIDVRRMTREIQKKVMALTSVIDIVSLFLGGFQGARGRLKKKLNPDQPTVIAFVAGLKKALQVLFKK